MIDMLKASTSMDFPGRRSFVPLLSQMGSPCFRNFLLREKLRSPPMESSEAAPMSIFPLLWESTGDQWWYASPIDCAAANGHYELVRELLRLDANLLIKLTSLRRIRRLETVWDDETPFFSVAGCRAAVARNLLLDCESKSRRRNGNSLIRAGYGGWLLYTAASAGDLSFAHQLLDENPLLVFGEGEYGVTDILYAAARSRNSEMFKLLFSLAMSPRSSNGGGGFCGSSEFRREIMNRAVHAAARGGNWEILRELLKDCEDILNCRDAKGSTVLHSAAGRGRTKVVSGLVGLFDIVNCVDNEGNTALHVAAFRGHLAVVQTLLNSCSSNAAMTNDAGDTFLHMAVAGFRAPGFRRLDRQTELVRQLLLGNIADVKEIVDIRNNEGRTALHAAVAGGAYSDLVELLRESNYADARVDGMTPVDLLNRRPRRYGSSEFLIERIVSSGGAHNPKGGGGGSSRSVIASGLRMQGIGNSPGTSFGISDSEIFLYSGVEIHESESRRLGLCSSSDELEMVDENGVPSYKKEKKMKKKKKESPVRSATKRLKILLRWPRQRGKEELETPKSSSKPSISELPSDSFVKKKWMECEETPTPLRQRLGGRGPSLPNNKRALSVKNTLPGSPNPKKFSRPSVPPEASEKPKAIRSEGNKNGRMRTPDLEEASGEIDLLKSGFGPPRKMNLYFCLGAQGLSVNEASRRAFKRRTAMAIA